ncbi:hypothetical protein [Streptomyces caeruleatus]|uniref:hypothetical protein n=1 Tax=Streptomyces caeruleatus TaxID=661399 RepID=UPI000A9425E2|nr:hypothetical protein [Streptomyces caeruleatus]
MAGERIIAGRYLLRQRLGSGGGGSVWLAEDDEDGASTETLVSCDEPHVEQVAGGTWA